MEEEINLPISEERVELSGWDISGKFFLEAAYLIGLAEGEIFAELRQRVKLGAPIFVRRLGGESRPGDLPTIYQIRAVESRGANGSGCVRLRLLKPVQTFAEPEGLGSGRKDLQR